jgi:hypothetical protein
MSITTSADIDTALIAAACSDALSALWPGSFPAVLPVAPAHDGGVRGLIRFQSPSPASHVTRGSAANSIPTGPLGEARARTAPACPG